MRIVSWNIQFGLETARAARELGADVELRDVDVLLLQEMDERGTAAIADALDGEYVYVSPAPHAQTGRDFGNAVVARWPIRASAAIELPHRAAVSGHPRSVIQAHVDVAGLDVSVYSVHTEIPSLPLARRRAQFATVAADVRRRGHHHVVVGGDFNTVTARGVRALAATMASAELQHVSSGVPPSYRRLGRELFLDHVFSRGFAAAAAGVVPETQASDHRPLWIELVPLRQP